MSKSFHYDFDLLPRYLEILYSKLRIAVVYGGDKDQPGSVVYTTHNPRPWKSYESVAHDIQAALQELGFEHVIALPDDMRLPQRLADEGIHLVWLNTGGVQGYNPMSHAPAMLEMLGIPYIGHNPLNAATLDNKDAFKRGLQALGIKTAPFVTWHPAHGALNPRANRKFVSVFGDYRGPFVVKPVSGRGSLHVHVVDSSDVLPPVATELYRLTRNSVLIEPYLAGREFCVAVCGHVTYTHGRFTKHSTPFAFSTVERVLEPGEAIFTSMDHKPITSDRVCLVGDGEPALKHELIDLARTIYVEFSLKSLVRVDVRANANGSLHVLEANPKPDLTKPSENVTNLVMAGLDVDGASYNDLILGLLADRFDDLMTYGRDVVPHLVELLMSTPPSNMQLSREGSSEVTSGRAAGPQAEGATVA